ncbi:MAG: SDR family NAD(P)-dependent oxidoreductase, partial [Halieaceae bacterium]
MKGLTGRTAVVTGAASGIGRAIAERLAEEGVHIVGVDRNAEALEANDKYASTLAVDLVAPGSTARVREHLEAGTGACDILVNAAGISAFGLFDDTASSLWDDTMAINVDVVARLTRELLPLLRASNQARIINIGST